MNRNSKHTGRTRRALVRLTTASVLALVPLAAATTPSLAAPMSLEQPQEATQVSKPSKNGDKQSKSSSKQNKNSSKQNKSKPGKNSNKQGKRNNQGLWDHGTRHRNDHDHHRDRHRRHHHHNHDRDYQSRPIPLPPLPLLPPTGSAL